MRSVRSRAWHNPKPGPPVRSVETSARRMLGGRPKKLVLDVGEHNLGDAQDAADGGPGVCNWTRGMATWKLNVLHRACRACRAALHSRAQDAFKLTAPRLWMCRNMLLSCNIQHAQTSWYPMPTTSGSTQHTRNTRRDMQQGKHNSQHATCNTKTTCTHHTHTHTDTRKSHQSARDVGSNDGNVWRAVHAGVF